MARQPAVSRIAPMPVWGLIVSGPLAGWRFAFIQLVRVGKSVHIDLRCTPPDWPFPQTVRFDPDRDELSVIGGPNARRVDIQQLAATALKGGLARTTYEN